MSTYEEIMGLLQKSRELGDDYDLREVTRWTVHCRHCGVQIGGDSPQTDKAFEHLKRHITERKCPNRNCVSRGGPERRRAC